MDTLRLNVAANFAGKAWAALTALLFIPWYIRYLGIESFGLVGILTSLFAVFSVLDLGLSTTLNRELARLAHQSTFALESRDTVRTLELVYWGTGLLAGGLVMSAAGVISTLWIKPQSLHPAQIRQAIVMMGLIIAVQWPSALYSGGLLGLQRQILLNSVIIVGTTVRSVGAILVLEFVSPTIDAFFAWQAVSTCCITFTLGICLWRALPHSPDPARFRGFILGQLRHFAVGMTGITLLAVILTQLDKIILSGTLSLVEFGYYSLAATVSGGLSYIYGPIFSAVFPELSGYVAAGKEVELRRLYHASCEWMSVALIPLALLLVLHARELVFLWTKNSQTADQTWVLLALLAAGTLLNGLMNIPYALQLAHGWTQLPFYMNLVSLFVLGPAIFILASRYGGPGAASCWVLLNLGHVLFNIHFMHRRLLRSDKWRWYFHDVGLPLFASVLIGTSLKWLLPRPSHSVLLSLMMLCSYIAMLIGAIFATAGVRRKVLAALGVSRITNADEMLIVTRNG